MRLWRVSPNAGKRFASRDRGHWHLDLYAVARTILARIGVTAVFGGDFCTCSEARVLLPPARGALWPPGQPDLAGRLTLQTMLQKACRALKSTFAPPYREAISL